MAQSINTVTLIKMTGINIQTPWSILLIDGFKTIETRSYPLPSKYEGIELALIETPGKIGKFKSRIIGTITFSHSFQYKDYDHWRMDFVNHKVSPFNKPYGWNNKPKYGWIVGSVKRFKEAINPPRRRGIVFTTNCDILDNLRKS